MEYKKIVIKDKTFDVILYKKKVKRFQIKFSRTHQIIYTVPLKASKKIIDEQFLRFLPWIEKNIDKLKTIDESKFMLLGNVYNVIYDDSITKYKIIGNDIYLKDNSIKTVRGVLDDYQYILQDLFLNCMNKLNISNCTLSLKYYKAKWGLCNCKTRQIILNKYLIHFDEKTIKSVIYHELTHLTVFNHSKQFYNLLLNYDPDYRENHKKLRNNAHVLR